MYYFTYNTLSALGGLQVNGEWIVIVLSGIWDSLDMCSNAWFDIFVSQESTCFSLLMFSKNREELHMCSIRWGSRVINCPTNS